MPKTADTSLSTYTSMMRVTTQGRPYAKDLYDMFSAVLLQVTLTDHRVMFRSYPYTFSTDEAAKVMSLLVFIHVHRHSDPADPKRQIATRTTTTFSMDYATAKNMIQHFLSARLIMSATDPTNWSVRDRGLWCPTLKGKYVMEEFTDYTQVEMTASLIAALNAPYMSPGSSRSTGSRIITLDRLTDNDDQITFSRPNMTIAFKAMMNSLPHDALLIDEVGGLEKRNLPVFQHTFVGTHCAEWLCERLTVTTKEEAEMVAAEFVLFGWIAQVLDKSDKTLNTKQDSGSFKTSRNAIYYVTDRGCSVIGWEVPKPTIDGIDVELVGNSSNETTKSNSVSADSDSLTLKASTTIGARRVVINVPTGTMAISLPKYKPIAPEMIANDSTTVLIEQALHQTSLEKQKVTSPRPPSMTFTDSSMSHISTNSATIQSLATTMHDNSHFTRLNQILETPLLRMYFRDFLSSNYCIENLNYWVDHRLLLKNRNKKKIIDQIAECFCIYETYIGPSATADVNIDHTLRQDTIRYVSSAFVTMSQMPSSNIPFFLITATSNTTSKNLNKSARSATKLLLLPPQANNAKQKIVTVRGTAPEKCLENLLSMFARVNEHVCSMMAEDSVPKFIKTQKYKDLLLQQQQQNLDNIESDDEDGDGYYDDSASDDEVIHLNTALSDQRTSVEIQRRSPTPLPENLVS